MKCAICGIETDSVDHAIDEGWTPYFYEEDKECGPACPGCSETLITLGEDGETQICSSLRVQQSPLQQGPHVTTAINNQENVHNLVHDSVNNAVRLKKELSVFANPQHQ